MTTSEHRLLYVFGSKCKRKENAIVIHPVNMSSYGKTIVGKIFTSEGVWMTILLNQYHMNGIPISRCILQSSALTYLKHKQPHLLSIYLCM